MFRRHVLTHLNFYAPRGSQESILLRFIYLFMYFKNVTRNVVKPELKTSFSHRDGRRLSLVMDLSCSNKVFVT